MKSISNSQKGLLISVLILIISYSFPSMFVKGGMDSDFHYLNFLFVLIMGTILIYDFYKIKFFKKILLAIVVLPLTQPVITE